MGAMFVAIPGQLYNEGHLCRALCCRLEGISFADPASVGYKLNHIQLNPTSKSSYLHGKTPVRSGAGALYSCQGWCRFPAGALYSCQGWCGNWPTESLTQCFPGYVIRRLSACTHAPRGEGNSVGGSPLFNVGIRNWPGVLLNTKFSS